MPKLLEAKVRNGALRSVAKGRRVMTNEAKLAISFLSVLNKIHLTKFTIYLIIYYLRVILTFIQPSYPHHLIVISYSQGPYLLLRSVFT